MIILGIDPGTGATGYGLVEKKGRELLHLDNGIIKPIQNDSLSKKLLHIFIELTAIINKHKPDIIALEEIFVSNNVRSALILGHARGVAMLASANAKVPVHEYSTREIKKALVGYGNADKNQVAQMVKRLLKLPEVAAPDASDALATAICHAQTMPVGNFAVLS